MAGHMICDYLGTFPEYKITRVEQSDIFNDDPLIINEEYLIGAKPDFIINSVRCLVDESEENTAKAIIYNSYLPHFLAGYFHNTKTKVIQLSSDCVFSGTKGGYVEQSPHDGCSAYAKTKSLGEVHNNKDITIRTSYIGPTLGNNREELFDWFLTQHGEVQGYCNALWTGVTTLELAKSIHKLIGSGVSGLYHLVPSEVITKYDLLILLKKLWGKEDVTICRDYSVSIDRSLIDSRGIIQVPGYEAMFVELHKYMENKKIYEKYFYK